MKIFNLHLDFDKRVQYTPETFVKGDLNSAEMRFSTSQSLDGLRLVITVKVPGASAPYIADAHKIDNYTAKLSISPGMLAQEGNVNCQAAIYKEGFRLTNPVQFYYRVDTDLSENAVIDDDDRLPILTQLITEVNNALSDMEESELLRNEAEVGRIDAENDRDEKENLRQAAEIERASAEESRTTAETGRATA